MKIVLNIVIISFLGPTRDINLNVNKQSIITNHKQ